MVRRYAFALVSFLSAFLLFQVQPMASKALLPAFGGSYLVWGAVLVFFQAMLAIGYAYAHVVQRRFGVARYAPFHLVLVVAAFLQCPMRLDGLAGLHPGSAPVLEVLKMLFTTMALPVFVLGTTILVVQRWLGVSDLPDRGTPYVLYAASNAGSLLGLLSYPLAVEPLLDLRDQERLWWFGFALMGALHTVCRPRDRPQAACVAGTASGDADTGGDSPPPETIRRRVAWVALGAAGCGVLLSATHLLTTDVASVPFLWILPLTAYLAAFVAVFKRRPWSLQRIRPLFGWSVVIGALLHLMTQLRLTVPAPLGVLLHTAVVFVVCLNVTGELAAVRPGSATHLTSFYLHMAVGGVIGSALVSWLAPAASNWLIEYPLSLAGAAAAIGLARGAETGAAPAGARASIRTSALIGGVLLCVLVVPALSSTLCAESIPPPATVIAAGLPFALILRAACSRPSVLAVVLSVAAAAMTWTEDLASGASAVLRHRSHYGVYRVYDSMGQRTLQHGTTLHGRQYLDPVRSPRPLAYYHPTTPAARVLSSPEFAIRRLGMIGLGTGSLAAYAGEGSAFTVFELDPDNFSIAAQYFTYLADAQRRGVRLDYVFGDARVSLGSVPDATFDGFVVDAFNSGSIPVHLITVEALIEYRRVLRPEGLLLLHVSNKAMDLHPVVYAAAEVLGLECLEQTNAGRADPDANDTCWMALTADAERARILRDERGWIRRSPGPRGWPRPWTDRYANLVGALSWR
jgi:SAM-dependent methyltransferase